MASKTANFKGVGIKTLLCALTALILALAWHSVASAAYNYPQNLTTTATSSAWQVSQTFTGAAGPATKLKIKFDGDQAIYHNYFLKKIGVSGLCLPYADADYSESGYAILDFTECGWTFNPLATYKLVISEANSWQDLIIWYDENNPYSGGAGYINPPNEGNDCYGNNDNNCRDTLNGDIYFVVNYSPSGVEINLDFPANNTSLTDFLNWSVSGYSATSTFTGIWYDTTSSTLTGWDLAQWQDIDYISFTGNFVAGINKTQTLEPGIYYARAVLSDGSWNVLASSTINQFEIIGSYYDYCETQASSTLAYALCQLFWPDSSAFNQFIALKSSIEKKPPIGYFYVIKNILTGLGATSTPAFILENASTTLASPIYNPLKNGITFILWFLFIFWIFNRIRNLDI